MICRLCQSDRLRLLYTQGHQDEFRFYRCENCGLVNYDLSGGLDQEKYAREFVDPRDERHPVNIAQTQTFRFLASRVAARGRLLEIGCGNGRLLMLARESGWDVRGIEISPFLAESVKKALGIEVNVADFLNYRPPSDEHYNLVVMRHVLEHLPDGRAALTTIHRLLAPNGCALLEFPNIDALDLRWKRLLRRMRMHRKKYPPDYRPGHCNEYNRRAFEFLAHATGFECNVWQTYSYRPLENWLFNRWPIGNKARALIRKLEIAAP
jgi:SAM-dependent methyltransferase